MYQFHGGKRYKVTGSSRVTVNVKRKSSSGQIRDVKEGCKFLRVYCHRGWGSTRPQESRIKPSSRAVHNTLADTGYNDHFKIECIMRQVMDALKTGMHKEAVTFGAKVKIEDHVLRAINAVST
jgi:hypothetical protein